MNREKARSTKHEARSTKLEGQIPLRLSGFVRAIKKHYDRVKEEV